MDLPHVIWQDGIYRIVLAHNEENDVIARYIEKRAGLDRMGMEQWQPLGERTWDEQRNEYVVAADWQYLALQLADQVPLPAEDSAAEEAGALDQAAEDRTRDQPAAELAEVVKEDEGRPYMACRGCGDILGSAIDAHALIERAHQAGWRTVVAWEGRHPHGAYALCPDCAPGEAGRGL